MPTPQAVLMPLVLAAAAGLVACSSSSETPSPAGAGGSAGADAAAAGAGGMAGSDAGAEACLGSSDATLLASLDPEVELPKCVKPLITGGKLPRDPDFVALVSACVSQNTGLSAACAGCYAEFAACSARQCLAECIADPKASACVQCRCGVSAATDCISALEACSGRPDDTCG